MAGGGGIAEGSWVVEVFKSRRVIGFGNLVRFEEQVRLDWK